MGQGRCGNAGSRRELTAATLVRWKGRGGSAQHGGSRDWTAAGFRAEKAAEEETAGGLFTLRKPLEAYSSLLHTIAQSCRPTLQHSFTG